MRSRSAVATVSAVLAFALAGCTSGESTPNATGPAGDSDGSYPVELTNCGFDVSVGSEPQRIVAASQHAAEILIHLGVGERIVGAGYEINEVPESIADEYGAIPQLSAPGSPINHEALLEVEPDFVYSTYGSDFAAEGLGTRQELSDLGVSTYLSEFDCVTHAGVDGAGFDMLFQEYRDLGAIFGVSNQAEEAITEQQAMIDDALAQRGDEEPVSVLWFYSVFEGSPWVAGGRGLPQEVSNLVGVENVYADRSDRWVATSYDEFAVKNPDVIIVADLTRGWNYDTAAEKIELLRNDPLTRELDAVVNDRVIAIPGRNMDASFGSAEMVPDLVNGLAQIQ